MMQERRREGSDTRGETDVPTHVYLFDNLFDKPHETEHRSDIENLCGHDAGGIRVLIGEV